MARKYELMYVLSPVVGAEGLTELHEKIKSIVETDGTIESVDHWGMKRLAYPIEDQTEGDYSVVLFSAEPDAPEEIQRILKITEGVMRYMIISVEE